MRRPILLCLGTLWTLCAGSWGCTESPGHPPVARFTIQPEYVPANTPSTVTLDARRSCDELDHPEACARSNAEPSTACPGGVHFAWSFSAPVTFEQGSSTSPLVQIRLETDRPVAATLRVTDCDGEMDTATKYIGVILDTSSPDGDTPSP